MVSKRIGSCALCPFCRHPPTELFHITGFCNDVKIKIKNLSTFCIGFPIFHGALPCFPLYRITSWLTLRHHTAAVQAFNISFWRRFDILQNKAGYTASSRVGYPRHMRVDRGSDKIGWFSIWAGAVVKKNPVNAERAKCYGRKDIWIGRRTGWQTKRIVERPPAKAFIHIE